MKRGFKASLLSAVACAVVSPVTAKGSLTINLSFGQNTQHGGSTAYYLTPDNGGQDIPVYVYATITGTAAISPVPAAGTSYNPPVTSGGNFDGLQYLYYNILNAGQNEVAGGIDATNGPQLNSTIDFNGTGPGQTTPVGAQTGAVVNSAPNGTTPGLSVGSFATLATASTSAAVTAALEAIPKPRANSPVFDNFATLSTDTTGLATYTSYGNDGHNIIINSATSVSFLVEKLNYQPATGGFQASTPGSPVQTTLSAGIPSIVAQVNIAGAEYFQDLSAQSSGSPLPTSIAPILTGPGVTLQDAVRGDANADGAVTFADLAIVLADYGQTTSLWSAGNFNAATDGRVDIGDLEETLANLTGPVPSTYPFPAAVLADPNAVSALENAGIYPAGAAVPEPAGALLLAVSATFLSGRTRRRAK